MLQGFALADKVGNPPAAALLVGEKGEPLVQANTAGDFVLKLLVFARQLLVLGREIPVLLLLLPHQAAELHLGGHPRA